MANNFFRAYTFSDDGIVLENGIHLLSGSASPQGVVNPTNSTMYLQNNGVQWYHDGVAGINGWNGSFPSYRYGVTASQSSTAIAFANLIQLTSAVLPIGRYAFQTYIKIRSADAKNGYGLRFQNGTAVVSDIFAQWRLPEAADFSAAHNIIYSQRALTDNNIAGNIGAAITDYTAIGEGGFTLTAAGTVAIQLRSETAGTAVTVGIGSSFIIEALP